MVAGTVGLYGEDGGEEGGSEKGEGEEEKEEGIGYREGETERFREGPPSRKALTTVQAICFGDRRGRGGERIPASLPFLCVFIV
jgi:hypothetical protein